MRLALVAVLLGWAPSVCLSAQALSAADIEAAIDKGREGKDDEMVSRCSATATLMDRLLIGPSLHPENEHFHVSVSRTAGRIAVLAAIAKRKYVKFVLADVPPALRDDAVFVEAVPHDPAPGSSYVPRLIEHIVLKAKNQAAVQPNAQKLERINWAGVAAGAVSNRALARFPVAEARELPAGDFDVVLITEGGERKCKVGSKDRQRLFGGR